MDRRTRICILVILVGLVNFLAYTMLYVWLYGEAVNGCVVTCPGGPTRYFLQSGVEVSRAAFYYSGLHSISIWPTVGAVMLAMLTLAKDRVEADMASSILRGKTLITVLATLIAFISVTMTIWFSLQFVTRATRPVDEPPRMFRSARPCP
jgi:hypothetical protein